MKGIILAGGKGSRLEPLTKVVCKQLLPIYNKPMIFYPLSTLMLGGIKDILIICNLDDLKIFEALLGSGEQLGITIEYKVQDSPNGIAEAFIIGEEFIKNDLVCLILGDNLFYGNNLEKELRKSLSLKKNTIFAYQVKDPNRYGVVDFDSNMNVLNIEEKPQYPKTNYAVTGLYIYDSRVVDVAKNVMPSDRGELEITDINNFFLRKNQLEVVRMDKSDLWLDTGTFDSLLEASHFIQTKEKRQGINIGSPYEVAKNSGWI